MRQLLAFLVLFSLMSIFYMSLPGPNYIEYKAESQCITIQLKTMYICSYCGHRKATPNIQSHKAYLLQSQIQLSILKIPKQQNQLLCKEFVQFINYDAITLAQPTLSLDSNILFTQIQDHLGAQLVNPNQQTKGSQIIESHFQQFVIFRAFTKPAEVPQILQISYAAREPFVYLCTSTFYICIAILALLLLIWIAQPAQAQKFTPFNMALSLLTLLSILAYTYSNIKLQKENPFNFVIVVARVLFVGLSLNRMEVSRLILAMFSILGVVMSFNFYVFSLFLLVAWVFLLREGYEKLHLESSFRYFLVTCLIFLANYFIWNQYFIQLADVHFQMIELLIIVSSPLALILLKEKKLYKFREFVPSEPDRKQISLSGFQEIQEEDNY